MLDLRLSGGSCLSRGLRAWGLGLQTPLRAPEDYTAITVLCDVHDALALRLRISTLLPADTGYGLLFCLLRLLAAAIITVGCQPAQAVACIEDGTAAHVVRL